MKKIILIFIVLLTQTCLSQDPFITIGKVKLRYDADSNKLRFGYSNTLGGTLKLARELDVQPFDFNSEHFSWSTTSGLNFKLFLDSVACKNFTLVKDTIFGETQQYKYWVHKRKYFNQIDSLYQQVEYYNASVSTSAPMLTFSPYNNSYSSELEVLVGLTTTDQIIDTLILSRPGKYVITSVFTGNFVDFDGTACTDSIVCSIDDGSLPGSGRLGISIATHRYNTTIETGGAVSITVTCEFYRQGQNNIIYLMAKNNQTLSSLIHEIWKVHTTAVHIF